MSMSSEEMKEMKKISRRRRYVDECLQLTDAAEEIGISRERMSILIKEGRVFAYKIGRAVLVPRDEIERVKGMPPRLPGRPKRVEVEETPHHTRRRATVALKASQEF